MKSENSPFTPLETDNGLLFDYAANKFPSRLWAWNEALDFEHDGSTCYIYITKGETIMALKSGGIHKLQAGQFFSVNEPFALVGGEGLIVECIGYENVNLIGDSNRKQNNKG